MTTFENVLIRSCPLSSHAQKVEDNSLTKFLEDWKSSCYQGVHSMMIQKSLFH